MSYKYKTDVKHIAVKYFFIIAFNVCFMMSGCTTTTMLHKKSDRALRIALSESPKTSHLVLIRIEKMSSIIKNDLEQCGVYIHSASLTLATVLGDVEQLQCVASKPYVFNLEFIKKKEIQ